MTATELAEHHFGTVCHTIHKNLRTDHDQKVPLASLTQFEHSFTGGDTLYYFPGLCYCGPPFYTFIYCA
jgi:hypothetical protein